MRKVHIEDPNFTNSWDRIEFSRKWQDWVLDIVMSEKYNDCDISKLDEPIRDDIINSRYIVCQNGLYFTIENFNEDKMTCDLNGDFLYNEIFFKDNKLDDENYIEWFAGDTILIGADSMYMHIKISDFIKP